MSKMIPPNPEPRGATLVVKVVDEGGARSVLRGASVGLYRVESNSAEVRCEPALHIATQLTDSQGLATFEGIYESSVLVAYEHEPQGVQPRTVALTPGCRQEVCFEIPLNFSLTLDIVGESGRSIHARSPQVGDFAVSRVEFNRGQLHSANISALSGTRAGADEHWASPLTRAGTFSQAIKVSVPGRANALVPPAELWLSSSCEVGERLPKPISGNLGVALTRTETEVTEDLPLWVAIRNGTEALSFNNYVDFIEMLFKPNNGLAPHPGKVLFNTLQTKRFLPFTDTEAYRLLKVATEAFVMVNCAVLNDTGLFDTATDNAYLDRRDIPPVQDFAGAFDKYRELLGDDMTQKVIPYLALIRRKLPDVPLVNIDPDQAALSVGFIQDRLSNPCMVELLWSYWHEEGMLVQTMNAVSRRFQNVRSGNGHDPLANLEIDPLRPLGNLIWGYTQDEQHRLTVTRRNYEYDHHYGLRLHGKAVHGLRAADTRSKFLEALHHLLRVATGFYKQDDDTTVKADAFPVLNALKEVHLILSQGAHNQFGDMPSTARIEMLLQQWLLGRPEFREFLPTRLMVAYPETWMDRVDAMKKLQGWTDTSVLHFRNLAIFGEQLLLSIRYGNWSDVHEPNQAFNWARFWRPQVQGYSHAYRAATGVDLSVVAPNGSIDARLPSLLLQQRLSEQQRSA
jgi:hypothetical protein